LYSIKRNDIPLKNLKCIYCDKEFSVESFSNYGVICPCCKRFVSLECEYGYGPVTPCRIYLGEEIAGIVTAEKNHYFLEMNGKRNVLHKTYLEAIHEAEKTVQRSLGIDRKKIDVNIVTKGGSLSFYGDWFGRPYDNFHKILHTAFDGEILEIFFEDGERLLVYNPKNIISSKKKLEIKQAEKVKWLYCSYGKRECNMIIYKLEMGRIFKISKYGTEYLAVDHTCAAVSME